MGLSVVADSYRAERLYVLGHGRFQWFLKRVGECDKTISSFGDQQTNTEIRSI